MGDVSNPAFAHDSHRPASNHREGLEPRATNLDVEDISCNGLDDSANRPTASLNSPTGHLQQRQPLPAFRMNDFIASIRGKDVIEGCISLNVGTWTCWQLSRTHSPFPQKYKQRMADCLVDRFALGAYNFSKNMRAYTLQTHASSHRRLAHLAPNLLAFNIFATLFSSTLEEHGKSAGPHLLALVFGSSWVSGYFSICLRAVLATNLSTTPLTRGDYLHRVNKLLAQPRYGFSAVINAVLAASMCLNPCAELKPFGKDGWCIPQWMLSTAFLYFETMAMPAIVGEGFIGHEAQISGAVFGIAYYLVFLRKYGGVWQDAKNAVMQCIWSEPKQSYAAQFSCFSCWAMGLAVALPGACGRSMDSCVP